MIPEKKSYRLEEVAEYYSVSKRTVYSWIEKGFLDSTGIGISRRVTREAMLQICKPIIPVDLSSTRFIRMTLNNRISSAINMTIRRHCHKRDWESIVGFTAEQLKKHLEKKFTNGMTWGKFIRGEIHIDHKIPKIIFNFETPEDLDFKKCWNLDNLQPMWAKENIKKKDKIDQPFQPSLLISLPTT